MTFIRQTHYAFLSVMVTCCMGIRSEYYTGHRLPFSHGLVQTSKKMADAWSKFLLSPSTQCFALPFQCTLNTWHSSCSVVKQVSAMSKETMITALSLKQFVRSLVKLGRWECHCSVRSLQALGLPTAFKDNVSTTKSTRTFTAAPLYNILRDGPRPHLWTSLNTCPRTSVRAARTIPVSLWSNHKSLEQPTCSNTNDMATIQYVTFPSWKNVFVYDYWLIIYIISHDERHIHCCHCHRLVARKDG